MATFRKNDVKKILRARKAGAKHAYKIVAEARKAGLELDLAFALVEQESAFRNIFGCDHGPRSVPPYCRQKVTRARVQSLLSSGQANGVGLTQLTYRPFVFEAEKLGGAHKPRYQLRVGFKILVSNIKQYGKREGIKRYNGSGAAAERYVELLLAKEARWHKVLNTK